MDNMKEACDGRWKMRKRRCSCDVGWKMRKRRCRRTLQPSLPHEVIENILSRLPVKDLLRFSVVCKQWEATISDPTFAQIHLQQYSKNPSSPNLLGWDNLGNFNGLHVAELRNNCIELVSTIEHSREYGLQYFKSIWCSFDGLYLMCLSHRVTVKPIKLVLWNPSRRMYRELYFPHSVSNTTICSMYYNPLMKDYRIVIGDLERYDVYAVYSCRDDKWGDVKEMKGFLGGLYLDTISSSVSVNGSIYWLVVDSLDLGDDDELLVYKEVLCFD